MEKRFYLEIDKVTQHGENEWRVLYRTSPTYGDLIVVAMTAEEAVSKVAGIEWYVQREMGKV